MRHNIDYRVPLRQAFGGHFGASAQDSQIAADLFRGELTMKPHSTWHLPERILWDEDPFDQRNWVFQFHTLRWMEPLRRLAMAGDQRARGFWVDTCQSWIAANPPGRGMTRYAWGDMVDGIRAMVMTLALPMFQGEDHDWLTTSILQHGEWLADPSNLGHSNHALHQHQALLVVGRTFNNQQWVDLAIERLMTLFDENFDEEGVNAEGSIAYHRLNYDWWETAFKRLDVEGIERPKNAKRLDLSLTELAYATKPNGKFERIGDIDVGGPSGLRSPEIEYVLSRGAQGAPPADLTKVYKAGYVFGRSGWGDFERNFVDETFYSISYGPANRVHGHQDGSSLTVHAQAEPWLVDAGKWAYVKDRMREYCLRRTGHNVTHIEDVKYDPTSVVSLDNYFLSPEVDDFHFTDKGYQGVTINRRIIYVRGGDFFIVFDTVKSTQIVTASQRWHLDPGTAVTRTKTGYRLVRKGGEASIQWSGKQPTLSTVKGQDKPVDGWMATDWMQREAATVISASKTGDRFRFIAVFGAGSRGGSGPDVLSTTPQGENLVMVVQNGKNVWSIRIGRQHVDIGMGKVFEEARNENPIVDALERVREVLSDARNRSPEPEGQYSPSYWRALRDWIRSCPDLKLGRLMALERLLMLASTAGVQAAQGGILSAVLDVAGSDLTFNATLTPESLGIRRQPFTTWVETEPAISKVYGLPIHSVTGSVTENIPAQDKSLLSVERGGLTLPVYIGRGTTDLLSVRFHGAINREKAILPIFQGLTSESRTSNSFVLFQDPTLDLDPHLSLGWFLGTRDVDLYETMADIVREAERSLGTKRIVFSGSSGGGFAALQVASYFPESAVVAFNAQTSVAAYHRPRAESALTASFGDVGRTLDDVALRTRLSALERYRTLGTLPAVTYVQNIGDGHHVMKHMAPFEEVIRARQDSDRVEFVHVDWGKGHLAPSAQIYDQYVRRASAHVTTG